jgi:predicted dehydrogenase
MIDDDPAIAGPRTVEITQGEQPEVWYGVPGLGQGYIDGMATQLRRFLLAVVDGGDAHPNFGEAVRVQQVVDSVELAAKTDAWVTVPPQPEGL